MTEETKRTPRSPREIFQDAFNAALFPDEVRYEPIDPEELALKLFQATKEKSYARSRKRIIAGLHRVKAEDITRTEILCGCTYLRRHYYLLCCTKCKAWILCPITITLQLIRIYFNGGPGPYLSFDKLMKLSTGEIDEMHSKGQ